MRFAAAIVARAIYTATKFGIADVLSDGPLTAEAIARQVDANPDAAFRMLRTLASRGIFAQRRSFRLTPLADALRADAPTSVRGFVVFWGDQRHWEHWNQLPYAVQTGRPAVDSLRGKPMFDFLDDDPEFAAIFNDGMTSVSDMEIGPVLAAYDFTDAGTVVDVGGGHGRLLAAILRKWPQPRGILFDAASVVEGAPAVLDAAGDRSVLRCRRLVLRVGAIRWGHLCAQAHRARLGRRHCAADTAKVRAAKPLDLEMLVAATGRERTAGQYAELLRAAGFRFTRAVPIAGPTSIVAADAA